jgi:hypothetical protein
LVQLESERSTCLGALGLLNALQLLDLKFQLFDFALKQYDDDDDDDDDNNNNFNDETNDDAENVLGKMT